MSIAWRLALVLLAVVSLATWWLLEWSLSELRPRYLEAAEEVLIDTSRLLAEVVAIEHEAAVSADIPVAASQLRLERFAQAMEQGIAQRFQAQVYQLTKEFVDVRVYVTDATGIVRYDSHQLDQGADYSQWRNILLTLRGEYGARSTRFDPQDPHSSVLHISAPIMVSQQLVGVLTVAKPVSNLSYFTKLARDRIILVVLLLMSGVLLVILLASRWIIHPLRQFQQYVSAITSGSRPQTPSFRAAEMQQLVTAFEQLRDALAGRDYATRYVTQLTHEMKSPLTTLRGAAEILQQQALSSADQQRFAQHVERESQRLHALVDRSLRLAMVENTKSLQRHEPIAWISLIESVVAEFTAELDRRDIELQTDYSLMNQSSSDQPMDTGSVALSS